MHRNFTFANLMRFKHMHVMLANLFCSLYLQSQNWSFNMSLIYKTILSICFTEYIWTAPAAAGYFVYSRLCLLCLSVTWDTHFSKTSTGRKKKKWHVIFSWTEKTAFCTTSLWKKLLLSLNCLIVDLWKSAVINPRHQIGFYPSFFCSSKLVVFWKEKKSNVVQLNILFTSIFLDTWRF